MMIYFRAGGNPPLAPGLFVLRDGNGPYHLSNLQRVAWWPAVIATDERLQNIVRLCQERGPDSVMSREEVLSELIEAGLYNEE